MIPARVVHNWDFTPRPVSRSSLQIINYIKLKPVLFNITELNSMLYGLVDELTQIKVLFAINCLKQKTLNFFSNCLLKLNVN